MQRERLMRLWARAITARAPVDLKMNVLFCVKHGRKTVLSRYNCMLTKWAWLKVQRVDALHANRHIFIIDIIDDVDESLQPFFSLQVENWIALHRKSFGVGTAWRWLIDDRIVIFPLIKNYFNESPNIRKHISNTFKDFFPSSGKVGQVSNTPFLKISPDYSRQIWGKWAYGMLWPSLPLQQLLAWRTGVLHRETSVLMLQRLWPELTVIGPLRK